jgi:O-antigen/teichoic acid export membrane protein
LKSQFQFVGFRVLCAFSFLHNAVEISAFSLSFFLVFLALVLCRWRRRRRIGKKNVPFVKYLEL